MALRLKITSGPQAGREFKLMPGMIVGRAEVAISISDPKMSGRHAKIEQGPGEDLLLVDLGSSNGLRVGDKRLTRVPLHPGLFLKIGNTDCEILADGGAPPPIPKSTQKPVADPHRLDPADWQEYLAEFCDKSAKRVQNRAATLLPFDPLLVLTITQGLQVGQVWTLGYGPREIGIESLDLHLFDESAPAIAFTVRPSGHQALFSTKHPQKVRLNGRAISAEVLNAGDEISVASTTIRVSFKE